MRKLSVTLVLLAIAASVPWAQAGTTRYLTSSGGDDTTAINNTINISAPGDTVYLNAGTFSITNSIQAKTGVAIVGAGKVSTTVQYTGGAGNPMVNLGGVSNVELANLTLNGNSAAQGITAWSGSGQYIHDTGIQNLAANAIGVYFSSAVTDSRIVNNQFSNIGVGSEWGAGIRVAWGSSRNQVLNNTIANAGRGGIFGNDGSTDLVIKNNTVTGSGSGGTGLGIEIWNGCDRSLLENNTVDQWLSVDRSSQVAVRNNTVNGGYQGLEFASGGHDNVFTNNSVNGASIGIGVSGPDSVKERVLWAHNSIQASTSWGAQIMSESGTGAVKQMYFYDNTFQGSTAAGFRFHPNYPNGSIQNVTLDSNTITANTYGITGGDWTPNPCLDKLSVINNTITNNSLAAFSGSMGTPSGDAYFGNDLRWEGNTVTGNGVNNQQTSKGTFFPGKLPSVSINAPTTVTVGQSVNFSLGYSGYDPLASVLWDLGDGLPATTSSTSFRFLNPGAYDVGLVVWDTSGRAAFDEFSLTVAPVVGRISPDKITVTAVGSEWWEFGSVNVVYDGSGLTDGLHDADMANSWGAGDYPSVTPDNGINEGNAAMNYAQFSFDQAYLLDGLNIWSLGDWMGGGGSYRMGPKNVLIEYSMVDNPSTPADWTDWYSGTFDEQAGTPVPWPMTQTLDLPNITAKHIALSLLDSWLPDINSYVGLSEIQFLLVPDDLPGDVNGDGWVGGDDLSIILTNWGLSGQSREQGDLTGEGFIGGDDYTEVLTYWGTGTPVVAAVPEPATLALLLLGGLALLRPKAVGLSLLDRIAIDQRGSV